MNNTGYKIVIADSQFLVIEALKSLLANNEQFTISGIVETQRELIKVIEKETCQLLIVDTVLSDFDEPVDLQFVKQQYPGLSVLVLTNSISKAEFTELSKIGIKNIIYKTADREEILAAIDAALKGKNISLKR